MEKKNTITINETTDRLLCKAKRIDNGEWIHGFVYTIWDKAYILWGMTNDKPDMVEVDPETISQGTGKMAKNEKQIFENAILRCPEDEDDDLLVVRWDEEKCGFVLDVYNIPGMTMEYGWDETAGNLDVVDTCDFDDYYSLEHFEIVGNIFDNADLLNK